MNSSSEEILAQQQMKRIPASSLLRVWCLGNTQARIAASYLSYAIRRNFLAGDRKQQAYNRTKLDAAVQLLGTMGYLRGVVMKLGQLFANLPQIMGPDLVEIFESLQFEAPPMHYSLIREVFLDELGHEPEEVFSSFDKRAFAAASLGQVHRARLQDGTEVAVKIQYPDIARTIESDFKVLAFLLQTMRFKTDFQFLSSHIEDARMVFLKEVDYLAEAAYMEKNREIFTGSEIVVPKHYPQLTTRRVLTMEYLPGLHLKGFLATDPSRDERNRFGRLISYSLIHSYFRYRTIYADLHPGNYIFMPDGRLGFIDFGCFRQFSPERWHFQLESETAMFGNDREKLLQFLAKVAFHDDPANLDRQWVDMMLRQIKWMVRPITAGGPFDFSDKQYVEEGIHLFKESLRKGRSRTDCFYNWVNRALLGHRSLMYRLRCNFDYGSLYLQEMEQSAHGFLFD